MLFNRLNLLIAYQRTVHPIAEISRFNSFSPSLSLSVCEEEETNWNETSFIVYWHLLFTFSEIEIQIIAMNIHQPPIKILSRGIIKLLVLIADVNVLLQLAVYTKIEELSR